MASPSITAPRGFLAGAVAAGIKGEGKLDLGLLVSEVPCSAAGMFTRVRLPAAPVVLCRRRLRRGIAQGIVANSGCANAFTGPKGLEDSRAMASLAARRLGLKPAMVLPASTGVTGVPLPLGKIATGLEKIALSREGGHDFARAIITTDPFPKEAAVAFSLGGKGVAIAGVAKGAGMIHPELATMLCFITTDAAVEPRFLKEALREAVSLSFNMITVDGDTSPNDTVLILANGLAGNPPLTGGRTGAVFQEALNQVCISLAQAIVRGGEGASKFVELSLDGAASDSEARRAARTILSSPLVKTAIHGGDPNWGRILAALGRSGVRVDLSRLDLKVGPLEIIRGGKAVLANAAQLAQAFSRRDIAISLHLHLGRGRATAWGCDLSEEYVTINSSYTT